MNAWKVACAAVAISAVVPVAVLAGLQQDYAVCYRDSMTGSGYCQGNFLGFRNSANTTDYAQFVTNGSYKAFYGSANGFTVSCTPDATTGAIWDQAMASTGAFYIEFDAMGYCTYLSLTNSSTNSNY
jgi:hypothetical protein